MISPLPFAPFFRRRTAGFVIPSAIFLVVILALLAAFLVRLSTSQSATSTQDIQSTRAYHAARAGIDYLLFALLDPTAKQINGAPGGMKPPFGSNSNIEVWPNLPDTGTTFCPATVLPIERFSVAVSCKRESITTEGTTSGALDTVAGTGCVPDEKGSTNTPQACALRAIGIYTLTATARTVGVNVGSADYVERSITSTVSKCRNKVQTGVTSTQYTCS